MCPFSEQQQRGSDKSVQSMIMVILAETAQEGLSALLEERYRNIWKKGTVTSLKNFKDFFKAGVFKHLDAT